VEGDQLTRSELQRVSWIRNLYRNAREIHRHAQQDSAASHFSSMRALAENGLPGVLLSSIFLTSPDYSRMRSDGAGCNVDDTGNLTTRASHRHTQACALSALVNANWKILLKSPANAAERGY
jgi:hypothetical protein